MENFLEKWRIAFRLCLKRYQALLEDADSNKEEIERIDSISRQIEESDLRAKAARKAGSASKKTPSSSKKRRILEEEVKNTSDDNDEQKVADGDSSSSESQRDDEPSPQKQAMKSGSLCTSPQG